MKETKWTKAQEEAITVRGGTVLVSAAAGSGKTAVLVQRVIEILTDKKNPVDANRILVVTFTNAAAAEMKQRIAQRLTVLISKNPKDANLLRQRTLLSAAQICTVDAFCLELVRGNFQFLDLSPDFRLGGEKEIGLLEEDAAQEVLEAYYQKEDPAFAKLVELVSSGADDGGLTRTLITLYKFIRSHPFYHRWLDEKLLQYDDTLPLEDTAWGQVIRHYAVNAVEYGLSLTRRALEEIREDTVMSKAYLSAFESDLAILEKVSLQLKIGSWDDVYQILEGVAFQNLGSLRGYEDTEKKDQIQAWRAIVKDLIGSLKEKQFCADSEEFRNDIRFLQPIINTLFELVKSFDNHLAEEKKKHHMVDFADIEHFAVSLLQEEVAGCMQKTKLAETLSQRYQYVLVDEYQDTNETQDTLFRSVSREDNLFMVGDVKQSIYRFRQAMPEIFIRKRDQFSIYDNKTFPAKLILSHNFRSRHQVTDCINYIFGAVMSREVGDIDYDDTESLVAAASYPINENPKTDCLTEVCLIENTSEELSDTLAEAAYVAQRVDNVLQEGFLVTEDGKQRPVKPGDICLLLRSPKNKAELYAKALTERGVNVCADSGGGFLSAVEISTVLSVLRAVDNPLVDINLTSAMMSPVFGFTPDEMAQLRLHDRASHIYLNCVAIAQSKFAQTKTIDITKHCQQFTEVMQELRILGSTCPAHLLIQRVIDKTGLWELASAMRYGESRKANLRLLIGYAKDYEAGGQKGISGFLRFVDRLSQRGDDFSTAAISDKTDAVRIMSVHRSKGLEFPIVFLCDMAKGFNTQDLRASILLHSQLGFACAVRDFETRKQYTTVPMEALRLELERSMLSEEMRILYVAMTRAKEKLFLTCVQNKLSKKLASFSGDLTQRRTVSPHVVRTGHSWADWLLMALVCHPDAAKMNAEAGLQQEQILLPDCHFLINIISEVEPPEAPKGEEINFTSQPDQDQLYTIQKLTEDTYPQREASRIPSKLSVSQVVYGKNAKSVGGGYSKEPAFLRRQDLTPTQKGTAMHSYMSYAHHLAGESNLEGEIFRLVQEKFLTPQEGKSLDKQAIKTYYNSGLYRRVKASAWVKREFEFMMDLGRSDLESVIPEIGTHKVTVQGIADLLFEEDGQLVLVDFKTDRTSTEELVNRYTPQLMLYAQMIQALTGKAIKQRVIYAMFLAKEILI